MTPLLLLAIAAAAVAALPLAMAAWNLTLYRRSDPDASVPENTTVFVCIPARDEQDNIEPCARAALESDLADRVRVLVYDDESTDATPEILARLAEDDPRLVRVPTRPLPDGWNGKQHACSRMARHAIDDLGARPEDRLLFTDADVRLTSDCLRRATAEQDRLGCALLSGFPKQLVGSPGEALMVPMMFYVLLGYLPFVRMRTADPAKEPASSAACGQFILFTAAGYDACGGHERCKASMHEGVKLPRVARAAGLRTDLFDASDVARVRMYRGLAETWRGFAKNAYEGLGSVGLLGFITALHLVGHLAPVVGLAVALSAGARTSAALFALALALAVAQRLLIAARGLHGAPLVALFHPVSVALMVAVQWWSFALHLAGRRSWRGRTLTADTGVSA